jgi:hypothetical protein
LTVDHFIQKIPKSKFEDKVKPIFEYVKGDIDRVPEAMVTAEAGMTITSAAQAVYIDPTKKLNSNAKEILTVKNWKDTNVTVYPIR